MALRILLRLGTEPVHGLSLLLTYAVHAALWGVAMALLLRRKTLSSATRHVFWKAALLGPLASCAFVAALTWSFDAGLHAAPYVREVSVLSPAPSGGTRSLPTVAAESGGHASGWTLLVLCELAAALGLLRFASAAWRLWRRLRVRTRVQDTRLLQRLESMRARFGLPHVVLSESADVDTPLVLGGSEICVPYARLVDLSDAELDSVFAHELAHLERRDWFWFPVVGFVQSVLWLQPLNHWIAARFRETAELACDDRAVELTRDPLSLAQALVSVAAGASLCQRGELAPAMARSKSTLLPRVKRLTAATASELQSQARGGRWAIASLGAVAIAAGTLSVQAASAPLESTTVASAAQPNAAGLVPENAAALSEELTRLMRRDAQLQMQLEAALKLVDSQPSAAIPSVEVSELQQALRHMREAEAWTEQRLVHSAARYSGGRLN